MSQKPVGSVIVPVLNREDAIGDLLVALKTQAGIPAGTLEIIVVDNGSTDRTVEIVKQHGVTLLHQPKRGPSAARNMGLAQAKGDYILCIDSDCVPSRRWAAFVLAAIEKPDVRLVTGPIMGWQPSSPAERYVCNKGLGTRENTVEHRLHPFAHGMHTTARREDLVALGGWDESMQSGEDVDLCIRFDKRFGKPICFVDQAVIYHKHRTSDEGLWKQARWHGTGYALVRRRHPDVAPWRVHNSILAYVSIGILNVSRPALWVLDQTRLLSPQRAEFERYHRRWLLEFWSGFMKEWNNRAS